MQCNIVLKRSRKKKYRNFRPGDAAGIIVLFTKSLTILLVNNVRRVHSYDYFIV